MYPQKFDTIFVLYQFNLKKSEWMFLAILSQPCFSRAFTKTSRDTRRRRLYLFSQLQARDGFNRLLFLDAYVYRALQNAITSLANCVCSCINLFSLLLNVYGGNTLEMNVQNIKKLPLCYKSFYVDTYNCNLFLCLFSEPPVPHVGNLSLWWLVPLHGCAAAACQTCRYSISIQSSATKKTYPWSREPKGS